MSNEKRIVPRQFHEGPRDRCTAAKAAAFEAMDLAMLWIDGAVNRDRVKKLGGLKTKLARRAQCSISRTQKIRKDPLFCALFEVVNGSGIGRKQPHFRTNAHRLHAALGLEMANV